MTPTEQRGHIMQLVAEIGEGGKFGTQKGYESALRFSRSQSIEQRILVMTQRFAAQTATDARAEPTSPPAV